LIGTNRSVVRYSTLEYLSDFLKYGYFYFDFKILLFYFIFRFNESQSIFERHQLQRVNFEWVDNLGNSCFTICSRRNGGGKCMTLTSGYQGRPDFSKGIERRKMLKNSLEHFFTHHATSEIKANGHMQC
jgi:hypothetical protein